MVDTSVYTPANLFEIIDGAADLYLIYGFVELRVGEYTGADSLDVRVELYRHDSPEMAFGIYSQERKPEYDFLSIGTQGYIEDNVLNFLAGEFYVKLSSHASGESARRALLMVAGRMVSHLNRPAGVPAALRLFPADDKIANGEVFVARDFLGYSTLSRAYVVPYKGANPHSLFLIPLESPDEAQGMLKRYLALIKEGRAARSEIPFLVDDPNNGPIGVFQRGRFIGGVMGLANSTLQARILKEFARSLPSQ
jgi:hypothetical protein